MAVSCELAGPSSVRGVGASLSRSFKSDYQPRVDRNDKEQKEKIFSGNTLRVIGGSVSFLHNTFCSMISDRAPDRL